MKWEYVLALLVIFLLPFALYALLKPQPGCTEGTLYVNVDDREITVGNITLDVRGLFYEGNVSYNAWDLMYELNSYSGSVALVCYDEEKKVELIEVNGRSFEKYEYD